MSLARDDRSVVFCINPRLRSCCSCRARHVVSHSPIVFIRPFRDKRWSTIDHMITRRARIVVALGQTLAVRLPERDWLDAASSGVCVLVMSTFVVDCNDTPVSATGPIEKLAMKRWAITRSDLQRTAGMRLCLPSSEALACRRLLHRARLPDREQLN